MRSRVGGKKLGKENQDKKKFLRPEYQSAPGTHRKEMPRDESLPEKAKRLQPSRGGAVIDLEGKPKRFQPAKSWQGRSH